MSAHLASLARRAVASPHWRWLRGMRVVYAWDLAARDRYLRTDGTGVHLVVEDPAPDGGPLTWLRKRPAAFARDCLPDLDDAATQGCVLAIIAGADSRRSMVDALTDVAHEMRRGLSYPEALVTVLERCPAPSPEQLHKEVSEP